METDKINCLHDWINADGSELVNEPRTLEVMAGMVCSKCKVNLLVHRAAVHTKMGLPRWAIQERDGKFIDNQVGGRSF